MGETVKDARARYVAEHGLLDETDADWRGTPLRAGALAVWVVGNNTAVEGTVISWDRHYVNVQPLRRSYRLGGGVARGNDYETRPQNVDRMKVTILRPSGPGQRAGDA